MKSYIEKGKHIAIFIKDLCKVWISIWRFVDQDSSLLEEEKLGYFTLILNNAEVGDLKKIASVSSLETFVCSKPDFLILIEESEKLIGIIDAFDIKFTSLNFDGVSEDIRQYVYKNHNYSINPQMLFLMISTFGELNEENFNKSNYASIQLSKCDLLIDYVDSHIDKYIDAVYLNLDENKEEKLTYLIDLLNHSEIKKTDQERILLWTKTLVKDISELETPLELIDFLLQNSKAEVNWSNVVFVYKEKKNSFSEILLHFINDPDNAKTLSAEVFGSKEKKHVAFRRAFLVNNDIKDELYIIYINAFPFFYGDLNFETLSEPKVLALVDKRKLSFNLDNYNKLKSNFSSLHLILAIKNITSFFKTFSEINLSEQELIELLENSSLEISNKIKLIELFEAKNAITEIKALTLIGNINLSHSVLKLSENTMSSVLLKSSLRPDKKIELFIRNISMFTSDFMPNFLNALGGKYKELNEKGPMPSFRKTDSLVVFFDYLKRIGKISKIKNKDNMIKVTTFRN